MLSLTRPSWASLGILFLGLAGLWLAWGGLLLLGSHPRAFSIFHLDALPRALQDAYTIGVYGSLPPALVWFWRKFEVRKAAELNLAFDPRALLFGLGLGLAGMSVLYGGAIALGWTHFRSPGPWPWGATGLDLLAAALFALIEEVVFRGVVLGTLLRDQPPARAIVVSALIYAVAHFLRPEFSATVLLRFVGLALTGVVFGYAAYSRRTLWLSIGMHAVWVYFIALSSQYNLWDYAPAGILWTGAAYPPGGLFLWLLDALCLVALHATRPNRKMPLAANCA